MVGFKVLKWIWVLGSVAQAYAAHTIPQFYSLIDEYDQQSTRYTHLLYGLDLVTRSSTRISGVSTEFPVKRYAVVNKSVQSPRLVFLDTQNILYVFPRKENDPFFERVSYRIIDVAMSDAQDDRVLVLREDNALFWLDFSKAASSGEFKFTKIDITLDPKVFGEIKVMDFVRHTGVVVLASNKYVVKVELLRAVTKPSGRVLGTVTSPLSLYIGGNPIRVMSDAAGEIVWVASDSMVSYVDMASGKPSNHKMLTPSVPLQDWLEVDRRTSDLVYRSGSRLQSRSISDLNPKDLTLDVFSFWELGRMGIDLSKTTGAGIGAKLRLQFANTAKAISGLFEKTRALSARVDEQSGSVLGSFLRAAKRTFLPGVSNRMYVIEQTRDRTHSKKAEIWELKPRDPNGDLARLLHKSNQVDIHSYGVVDQQYVVVKSETGVAWMIGLSDEKVLNLGFRLSAIEAVSRDRIFGVTDQGMFLEFSKYSKPKFVAGVTLRDPTHIKEIHFDGSTLWALYRENQLAKIEINGDHVRGSIEYRDLNFGIEGQIRSIRVTPGEIWIISETASRLVAVQRLPRDLNGGFSGQLQKIDLTSKFRHDLEGGSVAQFLNVYTGRAELRVGNDVVEISPSHAGKSLNYKIMSAALFSDQIRGFGLYVGRFGERMVVPTDLCEKALQEK